jgi:hypothetical protein
MNQLQLQQLPPWFTKEEWEEVQAIIMKYGKPGAVDAFLEHRFADARKLMSEHFDQPRESLLMHRYMTGVRLSNHR